MSKKGRKANNASVRAQWPRRRRGRVKNDARTKCVLRLSNMGMMFDPRLTTEELKEHEASAKAKLPPFNHLGEIDSPVEVMIMAMNGRGVSVSDAVECIDMLRGTKACIPWYELPDFDPSAENQQEFNAAKESGMGDIAASAGALRKKMSSKAAAERKKVNAWRGQW